MFCRPARSTRRPAGDTRGVSPCTAAAGRADASERDRRNRASGVSPATLTLHRVADVRLLVRLDVDVSGEVVLGEHGHDLEALLGVLALLLRRGGGEAYVEQGKSAKAPAGSNGESGRRARGSSAAAWMKRQAETEAARTSRSARLRPATRSGGPVWMPHHPLPLLHDADDGLALPLRLDLHLFA